jgi:hypothetical protein
MKTYFHAFEISMTISARNSVEHRKTGASQSWLISIANKFACGGKRGRERVWKGSKNRRTPPKREAKTGGRAKKREGREKSAPHEVGRKGRAKAKTRGEPQKSEHSPVKAPPKMI